MNARLAAGAIDIWHLELDAPAVAPELLAPDELARAERLRLDGKRRQFLAGRSHLRRILASYLEIPPQAVEFGYGPHGKPFLTTPDTLAFNLSHSGSRGLLAVGPPELELGIDVEFRKPNRRFAGLAGRFFAPDEAAALLALPSAAHADAFYRAWTCKEAYLKACGTGLTFASNRFAIEYIDTPQPHLLRTEMPGDEPGGYHLHPIAVTGDYDAALCYRADEHWLRHFTRSS